jgi:hypothetical protein
MNGYVSLKDILAADAKGTLEELGYPNYDSYQTKMDAMNDMGHFTASHWMDYSLKDEFYLKGWSLGNEKPSKHWLNTRNLHYLLWLEMRTTLEQDPHYDLDQNTVNCINAMYEKYNW